MNSLWSLVSLAALVTAQKAPDVENVIKPKLSLIEQQVPGIWIMDEFVFIQPRMITVEVPGKGRQLLWYMVYRVTNRSDTPRMFVPDFLLVDNKGKAYRDTIIPKAQRAVQAREDPLRPLDNSVTIVGEVEPSAEEGIDKSRYGVAIWEGIDPKIHSFSIYVLGLSNGFHTLDDAATGEPKVQRKALELKFGRPGDEFYQNEREIHYLGQEWIYR